LGDLLPFANKKGERPQEFNEQTYSTTSLPLHQAKKEEDKVRPATQQSK
jgi:hypothetical protein